MIRREIMMITKIDDDDNADSHDNNNNNNENDHYDINNRKYSYKTAINVKARKES